MFTVKGAQTLCGFVITKFGTGVTVIRALPITVCEQFVVVFNTLTRS